MSKSRIEMIPWLSSEPAGGVTAKLVDDPQISHGWVVLADEPINGPQVCVHFILRPSTVSDSVGDGQYVNGKYVAMAISELVQTVFDMCVCEVHFDDKITKEFKIEHSPTESQTTSEHTVCYGKLP